MLSSSQSYATLVARMKAKGVYEKSYLSVCGAGRSGDDKIFASKFPIWGLRFELMRRVDTQHYRCAK